MGGWLAADGCSCGCGFRFVCAGGGWVAAVSLSFPLWVAVDLDLVVVMEMCFGFLWCGIFLLLVWLCEDLIGR